MTGERSGLDQGEGKYEPDSSALCETHALPVSMFHVRVCVCVCGCIKA